MATVDIYKIKVQVSGDQNINNVRKNVNKLENSLNSAGKALLAFAATATAAFVGVGVSAFRMADALADSANGLGITTKALFLASNAAEQSGGKFEDGAKLMGKFALALDMVAKGSEDMQDDFAKLGVTLDDVARLTDEELFQKTVDGLDAMKDGSEKTAVSMKIMGKSARDIDFDTFNEKLKEGGKEAEEAARLIDKAGTAADVLEDLFRKLQITALDVFEPFIDQINATEISMDQMGETIARIGGVLAAIVSVGVMAGLAQMVLTFAALGATIAVVVGGLTTMYALTGVGLIVVAAAGVAGVAAYKGIKNQLDDVSNSTKNATRLAEKQAEKLRKIESIQKDEAAIVEGKTAQLKEQLDAQNDLRRALIDIIGVEGSHATFMAANLKAQADTRNKIAVLEGQILAEETQSGTINQLKITALREQQNVLQGQLEETVDINTEEFKRLNVIKERTRLEEKNQRLIESNARNQIADLDTQRLLAIARGEITMLSSDAAFEILKKQVELEKEKAKVNADIVKQQKELNDLRSAPDTAFDEYTKAFDAYMDASEILSTIDPLGDPAKYDEMAAQVDQLGEDTNRLSDAWKSSRDGTPGLIAAQQQLIDGNNDLIAELDEGYETDVKNFQDNIDAKQAIIDSYTAGAISALEQISLSMSAFELTQDAITQTWGKIGSAIDDMVDNGKSSFSDLADSILKDLAKMIIKAYIFKALTGLGGSLGFDMSFLEGKATGGPVDGKTPYMVGERGPELFVPQGAGNIIPNHRLQSGGGSSTQAMQAAPTTNNYITNNISALDSRSVAQVFAENRQSLLGTVEYARKETSYGV